MYEYGGKEMKVHKGIQERGRKASHKDENKNIFP
jgi:hypothetical protein